MKEYRIQFLDDKKFETLSLVNPRYVNTKDDLGFADMLTDRIFVRRTGVSFLDQFTTAHEIEEILAKNSAHTDEWNIRHKKGRQILNPIAKILSVIPGPWQLPALATAVGTQVRAVQKKEAPAWSIPVAAAPYAASKFLAGFQAPGTTAKTTMGTIPVKPTLAQKIMGGAKNIVGMGDVGNVSGVASSIPTVSPTIQTAGSQTGQQVVSNIMEKPVTFGQTAQGAGFQATQSPTGILGFQTPAQTTPISKTSFTAPPQVPAAPGGGAGGGEITTKTPTIDKWLGANWRQTLLGASVPLIGQSMMGQQMFPPGSENVPFTPEQSQLFQETADMVKQGAQVQLNPAQQQTITSNFDDALETARQNIMDRYKMLRPGSDIENDSNFREALIELESDFAEKKANAVAGAQLGLSQTQTAMMSELAAMEIYTLSVKAGISYQEAKNFKDMLGSLGFMIAKSGQPTIYTGR